MKRIIRIALISALGLSVSTGVYADVGVTDACQDDIKDLKDDIDRNKDDYTSESRRKANNQLNLAKTNRLNPAKCRKNVMDARQDLAEGKRDKAKKNHNKD